MLHFNAVDGTKRCFACDDKKTKMLLDMSTNEEANSSLSHKLRSESQKLFVSPVPPYRSVVLWHLHRLVILYCYMQANSKCHGFDKKRPDPIH